MTRARNLSSISFIHVSMQYHPFIMCDLVMSISPIRKKITSKIRITLMGCSQSDKSIFMVSSQSTMLLPVNGLFTFNSIGILNTGASGSASNTSNRCIRSNGMQNGKTFVRSAVYGFNSSSGFSGCSGVLVGLGFSVGCGFVPGFVPGFGSGSGLGSGSVPVFPWQFFYKFLYIIRGNFRGKTRVDFWIQFCCSFCQLISSRICKGCGACAGYSNLPLFWYVFCKSG